MQQSADVNKNKHVSYYSLQPFSPPLLLQRFVEVVRRLFEFYLQKNEQHLRLHHLHIQKPLPSSLTISIHHHPYIHNHRLHILYKMLDFWSHQRRWWEGKAHQIRFVLGFGNILEILTFGIHLQPLVAYVIYFKIRNLSLAVSRCVERGSEEKCLVCRNQS